jgi:PKD repeat protein
MRDPPPHTYTYDGVATSTQFTVTLTATTPGGSHQATQVITVGDATPCQAPTAGFTGTPGGGPSPLTVVFDDTSLENNCPIDSWSWDFGDGSAIVTEQNPTHTFTNTGPEPFTFTIRLTVTSAAGSDFVEHDLVVDPG